ncbi:hypothetical protein [Bradyrhizobium japonicum]|uniref:hypothetical protein n=1 Tax=Bradyrhizobium japonicum TaxID=375 RepID=UPI0034E46CBD
MTYYSLLAIFPAIAALVAVYGLFSVPMTLTRHLDQLGEFLPGGAIDVARAAHKGLVEGITDPWPHLRHWPWYFALERKCGHEVSV